MPVDTEAIREIERKISLRALREDPEVRQAIWLVVRSEFADTAETARCLGPVLAEAPRDDEEQRRKSDN